MKTQFLEYTIANGTSESDAEIILQIIAPYVKNGLLLPRTKLDIMKNINDFFIAKYEGMGIGCATLKDYSDGLYEIRTLVVKSNYSNNGIGSKLINSAVEKVKTSKKGKIVFALTTRANVFINQGFEIVSKEIFPEKIWQDCSKCLKFSCCDEIAVRMILDAAEKY